MKNGTLVAIYNTNIFFITDNNKIRIPGKNLFVFNIGTCGKNCTISDNVLLKFTRSDLVSACKDGIPNIVQGNVTDNKLFACSQLFIENAMKFPDDYPIKF